MKEIDVFRNKMSRSPHYNDVVYPTSRTPDQTTLIEKASIVVDFEMVKKWNNHFKNTRPMRASKDALICFIRGVFPFHSFTEYTVNNPHTSTNNDHLHYYEVKVAVMEGDSIKDYKKLWRGNHVTYFIQHILEALNSTKKRRNFWKETETIPKAPKDSKYIFTQYGETEIWEGKVTELVPTKSLPVPPSIPKKAPASFNIDQEEKKNPRQKFERGLFKLMKEFQEESGMVLNSLIYENMEPSKTCGADMAFDSNDWNKPA